MKAHIFQFDPDGGASNGGGESRHVCVDRKVHLVLASSWYDQTGDWEAAYDRVYYSVVGPCDGSCLPHMELPAEAEALVQRFLTSDGKDRGEYVRRTPRHPEHA